MKKSILRLLLVLFAALFACKKTEIEPIVPINPIRVQSVVLNKSSTSILEGKSETLTATVTPAEADNKAVAWSTSDAVIATVSTTGVVTAVKEGTVTITATTQEGGHTATCVVTVSNTVVLVTGITLDQSTVSIKKGLTATLVAAVAPENATNQNIDWVTSDATIATVSAQGVVTAVGEGVATITATTQEGDHTATCMVTVSFDALGALAQDPSGDIAAMGATITVSSPNAPAGLAWTAALSNLTGFTLGTATGSGATGSVPVTVSINPTNTTRSSILTARGSNGSTSSIELTQAPSSLGYSSPSATTPVLASATSVAFTVTGTAGLILTFIKEDGGDAAFSTPADHTCDGSVQTITVTMAVNAGLARQATYSAQVTNAGASGLDLTDITVKQTKVADPRQAAGYVSIAGDGTGLPDGLMCVGLFGGHDGTNYTKGLYLDKRGNTTSGVNLGAANDNMVPYGARETIYGTANTHNGLTNTSRLTGSECAAANYCRGKGMYLPAIRQLKDGIYAAQAASILTAEYTLASKAYWSSTERTGLLGWTVVFDNGADGSAVKSNNYAVRCVMEF